jgi:hypothetical protein
MGSQTLTDGLGGDPQSHGNQPTLTPNGPLPWVVQKFGGTSVGKFPTNISQIIQYAATHLVQKFSQQN